MKKRTILWPFKPIGFAALITNLKVKIQSYHEWLVCHKIIETQQNVARNESRFFQYCIPLQYDVFIADSFVYLEYRMISYYPYKYASSGWCNITFIILLRTFKKLLTYYATSVDKCKAIYANPMICLSRLLWFMVSAVFPSISSSHEDGEFKKNFII